MKKTSVVVFISMGKFEKILNLNAYSRSRTDKALHATELKILGFTISLVGWQGFHSPLLQLFQMLFVVTN